MPTKRSIEDIILQKDGRNIGALRPHLPASFVTEAAQLILEHPGKAIITTGFHILTASAPETDGPPGAVAIGIGLEELAYQVVHVTDKFSIKALKSIAPESQKIIEFPILGHRESAEFAFQVIQDEAPTVLISTERCGLTTDGTYRNFRGRDISEFNAKIDHLFDLHPASVGIGDGGNEIGMGNLYKVIPNYDKLPKNPCVTTVGKLIIASVSNWGSYGLVAGLSLLAGKNLLPSVNEEKEWVEKLVQAGAVEGMSGEKKPWVDGFPPDENAVCLRDLYALLRESNL
ncbi:MAG: DUF4392 domain-containing protein [Chloroflexi bacterium]|nr:DUF4392 domain-containing protein [Chloroflexota bacterium]